MKLLAALISAVMLTGCASNPETRAPAEPTQAPFSGTSQAQAVTSEPARWRPRVGVTWQWQLSGRLDLNVNAAVYDVDLFTTTADQVRILHARGRKVICYLSAGSWEPYRPDSGRFPAAVKGRALDGFADERWLDIRRTDVLLPIMARRMDLCRSKRFDAVEADNVDGYANRSGFPLTATHQLRYNRALASLAHARGLSIALKNDLDQVAALAPAFDFAVNEQCVEYDECAALRPFIAAGKPVLHVEYSGSPAQFCPVTKPLRFSSLLKHEELDAYRRPCP